MYSGWSSTIRTCMPVVTLGGWIIDAGRTQHTKRTFNSLATYGRAEASVGHIINLSSAEETTHAITQSRQDHSYGWRIFLAGLARPGCPGARLRQADLALR